MEDLQFFLRQWYIIPLALLRLCFVLLNNAYCIPTYVVWMMILSPLRKIHPDMFWKIEGYFFHWLLAMVSMWSWTAGYDIIEMGDDITACLEEKTLVMANHQSTADVPLLMAVFNAKKSVLPNLMWVMDRLFKYTNFGIVSVIHQDFFITAGKNNRDKSLQELAAHLLRSYLPRNRRWLVLFPEGGFLRKRRAVSQKYALKNNLPVLHHVTLPRIGALQTIMHTIGTQGVGNNNLKTADDAVAANNLAWILDITIAYPHGVPLDLPAIILGHKPPCRITLLYRLYRCSEIPQESEALTEWLFKRFEEKELILDGFYKTGDIPYEQFCNNPTDPQIVSQDCLRFLILHMFFITSTYVHVQMFLAAYEYYNYLMY